jgi:hypothetical protein
MLVGLRVTAPEIGSDHDLRFVMLTPDGSELATGNARIRANGPSDGRDSVLTFSLDLWSLVLPVPGDYSIRILIDGSERKRLPLVVEQRTRDPRRGSRRAELGSPPAPPFPPPTGQA